MKLTDHILFAYLAKEYPAAAASHLCGRSVRGAQLYDGLSPLEEGWAYVMDGTCLPESFAPGVLHLIAGTPSISLPENVSAILIPEAGSSAVLNVLVRAFTFYEIWEEKLQSIQDVHGTAEEMLQASLYIFHNPLMVYTTDLTVYAKAGLPSGAGRFSIFETPSERMETINAMIQDESYEVSLEKRAPYWGPDYLTGFRYLNLNLRQMQDTGYILSVMEDGHPLTEADVGLIEILGAHIRFSLHYREGGRRDDSMHKILTRVLSDRLLDYMEASRQLEAFGWGRNHRYLCLIYRLIYVDRSALPITSISNYMEEQYRYCSSFIYKDDIVTFFDLTRSGCSVDELMAQLRPFIRDSYLKAGFSRVVTGHMNLRRQYIQAAIALDVGLRTRPYQWIHYFGQIAMQHILEMATGKLPREMLCHEGVLRLLENDTAHGTEYIKTLRVYLDNQQNAVRSAKELFIHRSTFLYRLDKIRQIAESDLTDPEELLYIGLSLRLLEKQSQE